MSNRYYVRKYKINYKGKLRDYTLKEIRKSEPLLRKALEESGFFFAHLNKPTNREIDLALDVDGLNIKYLSPKQQTKARQIKAVKDEPCAIAWIKNPCLDAEVIALTEHPHVLDMRSHFSNLAIKCFRDTHPSFYSRYFYN